MINHPHTSSNKLKLCLSNFSDGNKCLLGVGGGASLIPVPSIERIYIHFADPIDTANYNCSLRNQQEVSVFRMAKSIALCNFVDSLDSKL